MSTTDSNGTTTPGVVVVTGAAGGVGATIARRLHAGGARVAVADLDVDGATRLAAELDASGRTARGFAVDIADRAAIERLRDDVTTALGEVTGLVNNAARTQATPLLEITPEELRAVLSVNIEGTFFACQVFGADMAARGRGRIVNMASLAGQNGGTATGGHYAASKGAIIAITKVFARELAARGVTVNAVSPGPIDSPTVRAIVGEERLDSYAQQIPVGRLGDAEIIADTVALLLAPGSGFVTGATWDVNGGLYVR